MRLYGGLEVFDYMMQHIYKEIRAYKLHNEPVNIILIINNGNEIAYEGYFVCPIDSERVLEIDKFATRFWATLDLFKYMVVDSPV